MSASEDEVNPSKASQTEDLTSYDSFDSVARKVPELTKEMAEKILDTLELIKHGAYFLFQAEKQEIQKEQAKSSSRIQSSFASLASKDNPLKDLMKKENYEANASNPSTAVSGSPVTTQRFMTVGQKQSNLSAPASPTLNAPSVEKDERPLEFFINTFYAKLQFLSGIKLNKNGISDQLKIQYIKDLFICIEELCFKVISDEEFNKEVFHEKLQNIIQFQDEIGMQISDFSILQRPLISTFEECIGLGFYDLHENAWKIVLMHIAAHMPVQKRKLIVEEEPKTEGAPLAKTLLYQAPQHLSSHLASKGPFAPGIGPTAERTDLQFKPHAKLGFGKEKKEEKKDDKKSDKKGGPMGTANPSAQGNAQANAQGNAQNTAAPPPTRNNPSHATANAGLRLGNATGNASSNGAQQASNSRKKCCGI